MLKGPAPTGEVVATVAGQEITQRELRAELAGASLPSDPKALKAVEQQALQMIIDRKLLAKAADDQGLDKTPDFALQKARTDESLLAETLQAKLAGDVPPPTREEAQSFISAHPDSFAARKVFAVDQIRMARPTNAKLIEEIKPLNSMDDIAALLTREHVDYRRGTDTVDALTVGPDIVSSIVKLPAGEVFVIPGGGGGVLINQIKTTTVIPFTGEPAMTYALALLKQQHTREAVARQLNAIVSKEASSVRYNPAYQPPAPIVKAAALPAGGPAAAG
jgi:EpsD family peptidyl-prolyl cis-trans isomerase